MYQATKHRSLGSKAGSSTAFFCPIFVGFDEQLPRNLGIHYGRSSPSGWLRLYEIAVGLSPETEAQHTHALVEKSMKSPQAAYHLSDLVESQAF